MPVRRSHYQKRQKKGREDMTQKLGKTGLTAARNAAGGALTCAALIWGGAALAQEPPASGPPPRVAAAMNLGAAGLIGTYNSDTQYGVVQTRMGAARSRDAAAGTPVGFTTGYEDGLRTYVMPITGVMALDAHSDLTFGVKWNEGNAVPNLIEGDGALGTVSLAYRRFLSSDTMIGVQLLYEANDLETLTTNTLGTTRSTLKGDKTGLRFDVLHKLSDHWGVAGRILHWRGSNELVRPGATVQQDYDQTYLQFDLVGQFRTPDLAAIPEGWVLQPNLGVNLQRTVTDSSPGGRVAEDYGTVWAQATLSKLARPGEWSPSATLGIAVDHTDDRDQFLDESTFVIAGAGLSRVGTDGSRIGLSYVLHAGVEGLVSNQTFVASYSFNF